MPITKERMPNVSIAKLEEMAQTGELSGPKRVCTEGYAADVHSSSIPELMGRMFLYLGKKEGMHEVVCALTEDCLKAYGAPIEGSKVKVTGEVRKTPEGKIAMDVGRFEAKISRR